MGRRRSRRRHPRRSGSQIELAGASSAARRRRCSSSLRPAQRATGGGRRRRRGSFVGLAPRRRRLGPHLGDYLKGFNLLDLLKTKHGGGGSSPCYGRRGPIWIQPEHPKQLTAIFSNLTDVWLWCIFPERDLNWTLFILEAAPALQNFTLDRVRHSCMKTSEDSAERTNVVWEPSKDLKHQNLKLLAMIGFEEEDKVTNFIRLVMELAVGLKTINLHNHICEQCNAVDLEAPRRFEADDAGRHRVMERLTRRSSSSVERGDDNLLKDTVKE